MFTEAGLLAPPNLVTINPVWGTSLRKLSLGGEFPNFFQWPTHLQMLRVFLPSIGRGGSMFSCPSPQFSGLHTEWLMVGSPDTPERSSDPHISPLNLAEYLTMGKEISTPSVPKRQINFILTSHFARCTLLGVYILSARLWCFVCRLHFKQHISSLATTVLKITGKNVKVMVANRFQLEL